MRIALPFLFALLAGCSAADFDVGLALDDTGTVLEDSGTSDGDAVQTDSGDAGDSGVRPDTTPPVDTGTPPTDTGAPDTTPPVDTGSSDTGAPDTTPPVDTGTPPTDTGTPPPDSGPGEYNTTFPNTLDGKSIMYDPYFWTAGDFYSGFRATGLTSVTNLSGTIHLKSNDITCAKLDITVKLESVVIGTVTIVGGAVSTPFSFTFSPIASAGAYGVQYIAKTSIPSGCGTVQFKMDVSPLTMKGTK